MNEFIKILFVILDLEDVKLVNFQIESQLKEATSELEMVKTKLTECQELRLNDATNALMEKLELQTEFEATKQKLTEFRCELLQSKNTYKKEIDELTRQIKETNQEMAKIQELKENECARSVELSEKLDKMTLEIDQKNEIISDFEIKMAKAQKTETETVELKQKNDELANEFNKMKEGIS